MVQLGTWDESYALANAAVSQMTIDEKLGLIIGTGQLNPNSESTLRQSCRIRN